MHELKKAAITKEINELVQRAERCAANPYATIRDLKILKECLRIKEEWLNGNADKVLTLFKLLIDNERT